MDAPEKPVIFSYKPYWISAFITPSWYAPFAPPPLRTKAKFSIQSPTYKILLLIIYANMVCFANINCYLLFVLIMLQCKGQAFDFLR